MSISNHRYYINRILRAGELGSAIAKVSSAVSLTQQAFHIDLTSQLADGALERRTRVAVADIAAVCDLVEDDTDVDVFLNLADGHSAFVRFSARQGCIEITTSAPSGDLVDQVFTLLEHALQIVPTKLPKKTNHNSEIHSLVERLNALEKISQGSIANRAHEEEPLRCFLSYRFSSETDLYVLQVQRFLTLLGVEVVTGVSYEPRGISDKILSRLSANVDFVLLLVTSSGESLWTRDEIAFASGKGHALVPVVEKGASFAPGLFGDLEYIEFAAGHIGDAFIKLLEAIVYFRINRHSQSRE